MKKNKLFSMALLCGAFLTLSACSSFTPDSPVKSDDISSEKADDVNQDIYAIYKLYLASGGTMTYEEWLESIRGADGKDGKDGVNGKDGKDGVNGKDGVDGKDGQDGINGKDGQDGVNGKDGVDGKDGLSAYEIFIKYHPDYKGSEEDWINDIASGNVCNLYGHSWDEGVITTQPTQIANGVKTFTCEKCNSKYTTEIPKIEVADCEIYEVNNISYVNYGEYPQTHINDETLISKLAEMSNPNSRGYYELDGKEYAKIVAKPYKTGEYRDNYGTQFYYSYSDGSKMRTNAVEYFLVEPIRWRILSSNDSDEYQICSDLILDVSCFYESEYDRLDKDGLTTIHNNNYEFSTIRQFVNEEFYNLAFNTSQQNSILTKEVDNSASTTDSNDNNYCCNNTNDKMFLLSYKDIYNSDYGFENIESRFARVTDYAKGKGAAFSVDSNTFNNGEYYLRSPSSGDTYGLRVCSVYYDVDAGGYWLIKTCAWYTYIGVRPACWIKF